MLKKILANSSWLLADQILRIGLGAAISIWVARYLGPEQLGAYSYAIALVSLMAPLAAFGLDSLVVRDLVRAPDDFQRILASAIVLRLCTGGISIIGAALLATVARSGDSATLVLALIVSSAALFQAISALDFWFQSKLQSKFPVIARDLAFLASAGTKILCVLTEAPIEAFGLAVLVEALVSGFFLWVTFSYVSGTTLEINQARWSTIRGYILEGRSLVLTGLLIAIYMRVDRVILGSIVDNRAVGIFTVAVQLCELFYVIPTIAMSSLYPLFVQLHARDKDEYQSRLIQLMSIFFYGGLLIALVFSFVVDWVILEVFGEKFGDSVLIAKIYIFLLPLIGMSIVFSHWYILTKTLHYSLYGVIFGAISAVLLNYVLISRFGALGAAIASLFSMLIPTAVVALIFDRRVGNIFVLSLIPNFRKRHAA